MRKTCLLGGSSVTLLEVDEEIDCYLAYHAAPALVNYFFFAYFFFAIVA